MFCSIIIYLDKDITRWLTPQVDKEKNCHPTPLSISTITDLTFPTISLQITQPKKVHWCPSSTAATKTMSKARVFLLLDWLPPKARDFSLLHYLMYNWLMGREETDLYLSKGNLWENEWPELWTRLTESTFCANISVTLSTHQHLSYLTQAEYG